MKATASRKPRQSSPSTPLGTTAWVPSASRLPNVACRFAEDGELLVKGPNVFQGYWKQPPHSPENFDDQGFFRTGDIGHLDADGFLYITDRKKELLKTSGGKLIAPQPIENKLKANLLVAQAALVGDRHKFASALISPNFAALEAWASQQGITAPTRRDLVADPRVVAQYQAIIDRVNETLANFETIKRFHLVPDEWSLDTGELTPSLSSSAASSSRNTPLKSPRSTQTNPSHTAKSIFVDRNLLFAHVAAPTSPGYT